MMMGRFRFNEDTKRSGRAALIVAVVLVVGIFFSPWLHSVFTSILKLRGDGGGEYALLPRAVLIERLRTAEDELQDVRYQAVLFNTQARTISELQSALGTRVLEAHMTARVMAAPPRTHYDTLLILAGTEDGVLPDDVVMLSGVAIGTVTEAYTYTSVVTLYSSPGTELDAHFDTSGATAVAYGVGGGALEARVPDELPVAVGDTVTDPRTGYVFGIVTHVATREIDTEQYVRISLPASFSDMRYVSLVHRVE